MEVRKGECKVHIVWYGVVWRGRLRCVALRCVAWCCVVLSVVGVKGISAVS